MEPSCFFTDEALGAEARITACRRRHVDVYLDEFVLRYNRRFHRHVSFETVLGLAARRKPETYWDIIQRDNPRKSAVRTQLLHLG